VDYPTGGASQQVITTASVIHAFMVPTFGINQDIFLALCRILVSLKEVENFFTGSALSCAEKEAYISNQVLSAAAVQRVTESQGSGSQKRMIDQGVGAG
jgi:hypothetical protein